MFPQRNATSSATVDFFLLTSISVEFYVKNRYNFYKSCDYEDFFDTLGIANGCCADV